jgi:hypothetical protein
MLRLLTVLCATLFLTLLIGGRDNGQQRFGLMEQASAPMIAPAEPQAPAPKAPDAAEVAAILAGFTPVPAAVPAPAPAALVPEVEAPSDETFAVLNAEEPAEEILLPEPPLTEAFAGFSPSVELIAGQPDPFSGVLGLDLVDVARTGSGQPALDLTREVSTSGGQSVLYVKSRAANVRLGPSTGYAVVGRVVANEAVSVLEPARDGWVRIKQEGDGFEGYIAASLLTDVEPASGF